jgi:hypothetical protein
MVEMGQGMSGWLLSNVYPQLIGYGLQKIALVASDPVVLPTDTNTRKISIEVFKDRESALLWLNHD